MASALTPLTAACAAGLKKVDAIRPAIRNAFMAFTPLGKSVWPDIVVVARRRRRPFARSRGRRSWRGLRRCCTRSGRWCLITAITPSAIVARGALPTTFAAAPFTTRARCWLRLWRRRYRCILALTIVALPVAAITTATTPAIAAPSAPFARDGLRRRCAGLRPTTAPSFMAATIAFWPCDRLSTAIIAAIMIITVTSAMPAVIAATPAMVPVPPVTLVAPIAAMVIAHIVPTAVIVEDMITIAGVPVTVIPAAAKTYVIKAVTAVTGIIAVEWCIGIAVIIAIAAIIIAKAHVINTA
jgi:hypothetical protein